MFRISDSARWFATFDAPKQFHVSPFNRVEGVYRFYFSEPGDRFWFCDCGNSDSLKTLKRSPAQPIK
ncbi:DUF1365 family protein [uncultured Desulfobacter sp.]|uniref:DUF1365 family protein n=1 Tax=uncultured Desulfobacter sp. TaxID=240139 RepID=UPI0029F58215|nr:DUF1365 family protein [uncultured Desulfobacter sp.]